MMRILPITNCKIKILTSTFTSKVHVLTVGECHLCKVRHGLVNYE